MARNTRASATRDKAPPQVATLPAPTNKRVWAAQKALRSSHQQDEASASTAKTVSLPGKRPRQDDDEDQTDDHVPAKRLRQAPAVPRRQVNGSTTASTGAAPPKARVSTPTARVQARSPHDDSSALSDDEGSSYLATTSSSSLSGVPTPRRYTSASAIAKTKALTSSGPQQGFMKHPKSQLIQREEDEAKAARNASKHNSQKKASTTQRSAPKPVVSKPRKTETQSEEEAENRQDAETDPRAKRLAASKVKRDSEKAAKEREIRALQARGFKKPTPYTLQLPPLPARQNTSGRDFPLRLDEDDDTFPLDHEMREAAVSALMDAMRDSTVAQDKVAVTTNFWHTWLKLGVNGEYPFEEIDMERVCRKLVNIAEALHDHGMGATDIYCRRTIDRACAAPPMKFGTRIEKLAKLMRGSKARCNEFMLGNTLEDTVALIDTKTSDLKFNSANNYLRSVKVKEYNKRLGFRMREKWPKDKNADPVPYEELGKVPYGTPESMVSPEDVRNEDDEPAVEHWMHDEEHVHGANVDEQHPAQYPGGFQGQETVLARMHNLDFLGFPEMKSSMPAPHDFSDDKTWITHVYSPDVGMHPGYLQQSPITFQPAVPMLRTRVEPSYNSFDNQLPAVRPRRRNNFGGNGLQHRIAPVATPRAANYYTLVDPSLTGFNTNAMFGGDHAQPMHGPYPHQPPPATSQEVGRPSGSPTPLRKYPTFGMVGALPEDGHTHEAQSEEDEGDTETGAEHLHFLTPYPEDLMMPL